MMPTFFSSMGSVCICACVCVRESERKREREWERKCEFACVIPSSYLTIRAWAYSACLLRILTLSVVIGRKWKPSGFQTHRFCWYTVECWANHFTSLCLCFRSLRMRKQDSIKHLTFKISCGPRGWVSWLIGFLLVNLPFLCYDQTLITVESMAAPCLSVVLTQVWSWVWVCA